MTQPSDKKAGYDRFIRSVRRNLNYWHKKIADKTDDELMVVRGKFMLVCRAIRVALNDPETVTEAAQLAIAAVRFAEQCSNWSEWSHILRTTLSQADDADTRTLQRHLGMFLRLEHKFKLAIVAYEQAIAASQAGDDQVAKTFAVVGLTTCYLDQKAGDSAEPYLTDSIASAVAAIGDHRLSAQFANNAGNFNLYYQGQPAIAKDYFEEALVNYRLLEDSQNCVRVLHNLGIAHLFLREFDEAKDHLLQADELQATLGVTVDTVHVKLALGAVYYKLQDWQRAEQEFAAIDLAYLERYGYTRLQAMALNNYGNALSKQHKYDTARGLLRKSGAIWQDLEVETEYGNVVGSIGLTYLEEQKWEIGLRYVQEAITLLEPYENNVQVRNWLVTYRRAEQTLLEELGRK